VKVVHIVVRNTSTLDYSIPYLCSLRQRYPDAEISVLYCMLNKSQVLRDAKYYDKTFNRFSIRQFDFADFLGFKSDFLKKVIRRLFLLSYYDHVSLRSFLKNPLFLRGKVVKYILAGLRKRLDERLSAKYVDSSIILKTLDPSLVLFDHRARVDFVGREDFYRHFRATKKPIILVPHAAHVDNETDEFFPFGSEGEALPQYCDHWSSFKFAKPYLKVPEEQYSQFAMIGHPGLDSSWISEKKNDRCISAQGDKVIRCLVMSRKFLPQGVVRGDGLDPGVVEFSDVVEVMREIDAALKQTNMPYVMVVKPHPSSSYPENIRALELAGVSSYEISYEPFFELLPDIDMVITEFSTSIAFTVTSCTPTIVLNSSLQDYVHGSWDKLEQLYSQMQYFVESLSDLPRAVDQIAHRIEEGDVSCNEDVEHFRNFYDDGAITRALKRTEYLLQPKNGKG